MSQKCRVKSEWQILVIVHLIKTARSSWVKLFGWMKLWLLSSKVILARVDMQRIFKAVARFPCVVAWFLPSVAYWKAKLGEGIDKSRSKYREQHRRQQIPEVLLKCPVTTGSPEAPLKCSQRSVLGSKVESKGYAERLRKYGFRKFFAYVKKRRKKNNFSRSFEKRNKKFFPSWA